MTARPDVPDTPDRTDAIARVRAIGREHRPRSFEDDSLICACGHRSSNVDGLEEHRAGLIVAAILATDDPAAVAALAATLAERHPEALLTALTNAGVLHEVRERDAGLPAVFTGPHRREVQQP